MNVNLTRQLHDELRRDPQRRHLTDDQRQLIVEKAAPLVRIGNHAEALDKAYHEVVYGIPLAAQSK